MAEIEKIDLEKVDWRSSREFFESLAEELEKLDDKDESYDFTWVGKRKSIIEAGRPINKTLRPDVEASKDFDNTKNMLIVGDNLDALKLLQESYLGKIKMIYIDPPYNTGHDFVYHDNFTTKKEDYLDNSTDEDGNRVVAEEQPAENSRANGRFHSDWLSMMYPRLKLARNLLADDGVIFISIDDNEQANLKKLCDEVFGEEDFISNMIWLGNRTGKNDGENIKNIHEYILVYFKKNNEVVLLGEPDNDAKKYKFRDEFEAERGRYYTITLDQSSLSYSKNLDYPIMYHGKTYYPGVSAEKWQARQAGQHGQDDWIWRWSKTKFEKALNDGFIEFRNGRIYSKQYQFMDVDKNKVVRTLRKESVIDKYSTRGGKDLLRGLFDGNAPFSYAKPLELVADFIHMHPDKSAFVLDFFAGSGTTGHAVMDLNAEDGGNRRYICIQLDEKTDEKSEAKKAGYDTIDQITAERLRRAGDKIKQEHPEAKIDTGFRVFRVDSANEDEGVRRPLGEIEQASLMDTVDNIKKDRSPLDLLFGAVYALALPFDLKLETRKFGDNTVYLYGYLGEGSGLAACFDENISEETVKAIAALKPLTAVFRDSSFPDSSAKINLSEHFRMLAVDTRVKVI